MKKPLNYPKIFMNFILIFTFISLLVIPFASAAYVCPAQHTPSGSLINRLTVEDPSSSSGYSAFGTAFTANATCYLYNATFWLYKEGSPTGTIVAQIYAATGTVGETAVPTGSLLQFSTTYDVSDLYGSYLPITFQFAGDLELQSATDYVILIKVLDTTNTWSSGVTDVILEGASDATETMNGAHYHNSAWAATTHGSYMPKFIINGDSEEYTGATPTPTPTAAPTTTVPTELTSIWATVGSLIQLIIPLMVVVLPAFFGYKFAGAWGFLAGINIGAILAYVILGAATFPLWGIVVILILDALLLFGKVGFHS